MKWSFEEVARAFNTRNKLLKSIEESDYNTQVSQPSPVRHQVNALERLNIRMARFKQGDQKPVPKPVPKPVLKEQDKQGETTIQEKGEEKLPVKIPIK